MSSMIGKKFRIMTFGESHGKAIGAVIEGVAPKTKISIRKIQKALNKRKPGTNKLYSQRKEMDKVHILSGVFEGRATGHPICLVSFNNEFKASDYDNLKGIFRPGHADYAYYRKYGIRDFRGSGRASGRETLARVAAGSIARQILPKKTKVFAYTLQVGSIRAEKIDLSRINDFAVKCPDAKKAKEMEKYILKVKAEGDSVGGIVECVVRSPPIGLGDPVFDKLNSDLGKAILSIPGVKGIEFGAGFASAEMLGSKYNDSYYFSKGEIRQKTNHSGGILGGISTGEDIVFRVAVRPISSIAKKQATVDIHGKKVSLKIRGRHDPCICPRVIPVIESMVYIVLADKYLTQKSKI